MTTRQFIEQYWYGNTKRTQCSNVFGEGGNLYSYGYHYPLLFMLKGKAIRNVSGYSNSTARHIYWTRDVDAIDVQVPHTFRLGAYTDDDAHMATLVQAQREYAERLHEQLKSKKRKNTQVYHWLEQDYFKAVDSLKELIA